MFRNLSRLPTIAAGLVLLGTMPLTTMASSGKAGKVCQARPVHHLAAPSSSGAKTVILFGVQGGNMLPWSVALLDDGSITTTRIEAQNKQLADAKGTLNGLLKLADAEGFFSMHDTTMCPRVLPDIASRFVVISTATDAKRVVVHGSCVSTFNQLYDVLEETADLSR